MNTVQRKIQPHNHSNTLKISSCFQHRITILHRSYENQTSSELQEFFMTFSPSEILISLRFSRLLQPSMNPETIVRDNGRIG